MAKNSVHRGRTQRRGRSQRRGRTQRRGRSQRGGFGEPIQEFQGNSAVSG